MSPVAVTPANNFMHAQSSICCISVCSGIMSIIFTSIIVNQMSSQGDSLSGDGMEGLPDTYTTFSAFLLKSRDSAISGLVAWCCCGGVFVGVGRMMIEKREGLKACCIIEGLCACSNCLGSLTLISYFIFVCVLIYGMSDPAGACASVNMMTTTVPPTLAAGIAAKPVTMQGCVAWVASLKTPFTTTAVWIAFLACCNCCTTIACATGAKFAYETEEAFDDEEYGGGGMQDYY